MSVMYDIQASYEEVKRQLAEKEAELAKLREKVRRWDIAERDLEYLGPLITADDLIVRNNQRNNLDIAKIDLRAAVEPIPEDIKTCSNPADGEKCPNCVDGHFYKTIDYCKCGYERRRIACDGLPEDKAKRSFEALSEDKGFEKIMKGE